MKEFHFVINPNMHNKIKNYCKTKKISQNKSIREIITTMIPFIRNLHFFEKEDNCKYRIIGGKKNIHLYFDDELYRELKLIHSNLNYYSIAILVRDMIENFFIHFNKNKNETDVINEMQKIKNEMKSKSEATEYEIVKVLEEKVGQLSFPPPPKFVSIDYTEKFSIFSLKLLIPDLLFI